MSWVCSICNKRKFDNRTALMVHSNRCMNVRLKFKLPPDHTTEPIENPGASNDNSFIQTCGIVTNDTTSFHNNHDFDHEFINPTDNGKLDIDDEILNQAEEHISSGFKDCPIKNDPEYLSGILLLQILKKAKCPIYLFDQIVEWAKKSHSTYRINFSSTKLNRKSSIDMIVRRFDLTKMKPTMETIFCKGLNKDVSIVLHDFKQLLMDEELMQSKNILLIESVEKEINDINTGLVYKNAFKVYVTDPTKERLIPINFFSDKTRTDIHGRLCLEPVQFTLGIFNRDIRNNPRAWRTIGYVTDNIYEKKCSTEQKQQDYHQILNVILRSYKQCQTNPVKWRFRHEDGQEYILKVPCLFIIGDTENHDKICGRMASRHNINYLCRYCDQHRENIDNPFADSQFTKMSNIQKLVLKEDKNKLASMSMHLVQNAWHDVQFCDTVRGVHGATLAELLHCLQQGIFEYTIKELFSTKKERKNVNKKRKRCKSITAKKEYTAPASEDLGRLNVFSAVYESRFESLCKQYGKMLQHQSDRTLPRTSFNTKYMTITRKNGHETMAGLILVFLMIFASSEGQNTLDTELGNERCAAYIHVMELLLMMESFCKQENHSKTDLQIAKNGIPLVMNTIKETINRTEGCGMKIIKFHLMKHFAEDVLRYGSMRNYDSAIGERHHVTEVKDPAKHTQRRKNKFEEQTAQRHYESLAISMSESDVPKFNFKVKDSLEDKESINKEHNILYIHKKKNIYKRDWKDNKYSVVKWQDDIFYQQLIDFCGRLVENGNLDLPISFFTQHKRDNLIFRANPEWKDTKTPWYDWAKIKWDGYDKTVPAQMLLFMDLSNNFKKSFQLGQSFVTESGFYALARTFQDGNNICAHQASMLVGYGELILDKENKNPEICIFNVESITESMVAVPFQTEHNVANAREWLILQPKESWYRVLINLLDERNNSNNKTTRKK